MLEWLQQNAGTLLVALGLAAVLAAVSVYLYRRHRAGKTSCGGACGSCPMAGECHKKR